VLIQILWRYDSTESTLLNLSQLHLREPIEGLWLVNVLEPVLCDAVNGGFFINICDTEKKDTVDIIMSYGNKEEKKPFLRISSKKIVQVAFNWKWQLFRYILESDENATLSTLVAQVAQCNDDEEKVYHSGLHCQRYARRSHSTVNIHPTAE